MKMFFQGYCFVEICLFDIEYHREKSLDFPNNFVNRIHIDFHYNDNNYHHHMHLFQNYLDGVSWTVVNKINLCLALI